MLHVSDNFHSKIQAEHGLIDYHCHLLPGMDDGARHLEDSLAMARLLVEAGFIAAYCTPHCIRGFYDTTREMVLEGVCSLQAELDRLKIRLRLSPGMEYYLDEYFPQAIESALPMGDSRLLLVEVPVNAHPQVVTENLSYAVGRGFTPLVAHPERVSSLAPTKERGWLMGKLRRTIVRNANPEPAGLRNSCLELLRQQGCLFQGNLGSFAGYYGRDIQRRARQFHQAGLYAVYGSDGHGPDRLAGILKKGLGDLYGNRY